MVDVWNKPRPRTVSTGPKTEKGGPHRYYFPPDPSIPCPVTTAGCGQQGCGIRVCAIARHLGRLDAAHLRLLLQPHAALGPSMTRDELLTVARAVMHGDRSLALWPRLTKMSLSVGPESDGSDVSPRSTFGAMMQGLGVDGQTRQALPTRRAP